MPEYRRAVSGGSRTGSSQSEQLRGLVPVFAVAVAIAAAVTDPSSAADLILAALAVGAFAVWTYVPGVPLPALSLAVAVPAVVAQRSGQLEPLLFEVSLLAFVTGRFDYHVRVACRDADDLDATVRAIRGEAGAAQTETRIVLRVSASSQAVG